MDRVPHFIYSDTNCEENCEYVYGVILAFPDEARVVESLAAAIKQDCYEARTDHSRAWKTWQNYSDKPYEEFLKKYPAPDLQKIIATRCTEYGCIYSPRAGGIKI